MIVRTSACVLALVACACSGGSGSTSGSSVPANVTNLGVAVSAIEGSASLWVTSVREDAQDVDLNGDGDLQDSVLHVYDPLQANVVNLGVAVVDLGPFRGTLALEDELLAAAVSEADQGEDLNGDGDRQDHVVAVFRPRTGERWSTALAQAGISRSTPGGSCSPSTKPPRARTSTGTAPRSTS